MDRTSLQNAPPLRTWNKRRDRPNGGNAQTQGTLKMRERPNRGNAQYEGTPKPSACSQLHTRTRTSRNTDPPKTVCTQHLSNTTNRMSYLRVETQFVGKADHKAGWNLNMAGNILGGRRARCVSVAPDIKRAGEESVKPLRIA